MGKFNSKICFLIIYLILCFEASLLLGYEPYDMHQNSPVPIFPQLYI